MKYQMLIVGRSVFQRNHIDFLFFEYSACKMIFERFKKAKPRDSTGVLMEERYSGPAVIVEAGFIFNTSDLDKIKTNANEMGQEIANGIINYYNTQ